ncbi:MAG TPA: tyrosine-type recombinase/integrase [Bryobacteraceae bacterium]|jgi:site-specific recombinase XerD
MQRAAKKLGEIEIGGGRPKKSIKEAAQSFLAACSDLAPATLRKYARVIRDLERLAESRNIRALDSITLENLDDLRSERAVSPLTWSKELPIVRQFFSHCVERHWMRENPAKRLRLPRNLRPKPVEPFTQEELVRIIAASSQIGRTSYDRARAEAMTLVFRFTALRISDVAVLRKDHISNGEIFIRAEKNGKPVKLPVECTLQAALDRLPEPRGSVGLSAYFFWSGNGSKESMIRDVRRTMKAIFKKAGVTGGHPHKFRHTLAVEVLVGGGTTEDVATILGDDPRTVSKHYAPWNVARQARIKTLMQTVYSAHSLAQTLQQARTC